MSDSIGGNAKTIMFVNVAPTEDDAEESRHSLQFARRCKKVANRVGKMRVGCVAFCPSSVARRTASRTRSREHQPPSLPLTHVSFSAASAFIHRRPLQRGESLASEGRRCSGESSERRREHAAGQQSLRSVRWISLCVLRQAAPVVFADGQDARVADRAGVD